MFHPTANCLLLSLLILTTATGGCWDRRELDTLGIAAGVGVDRTEDGQFLLTFQIIKPSQVKAPEGAAGGNAGGGGGAVWVAQSLGETLFEAVRNFTLQSNRRIFFPHNQIIVVGQSAAEQGIREILDFFVRDPEPRPKEWVLVSKGKASEFLQAQTELEKIPAIAISDLIKQYQANAEVYPVNLQDFTQSLVSKTKAPFAPMIEVFGPGPKKKFRLTNTAIFKRDKMIGTFNRRETRGLLWAYGKVRSGIIVINLPNGKVSLEILQSKAKVTPSLKDGQISLRILVKEDANLGEQTVPEDLATPDQLNKLERKQAAIIQQEIHEVFKKAQLLKADVFGIGEAVERRYPRQWKPMESQWEQIFPTITLDVRVQTTIRRLGKINQTVVPE